MRIPPDAPGTATITELMDALVLYDAPMLDHRFTDVVARHPDVRVRDALRDVPRDVKRSAHSTRAAAHEWERVASPVLLEDAVRNAERLLLHAFLDSAEVQVRLKAFLARDAPTRHVRDHLEHAISAHRNVTHALRQALSTAHAADGGTRPPAREGATPRYTQGEETDLRGQVEAAIRRMRDAGKEPRELVVSHVALRHLRDQECFKDGETELSGVPVTVDFAWEASEFALHSYESVALEEIVRPPIG